MKSIAFALVLLALGGCSVMNDLAAKVSQTDTEPGVVYIDGPRSGGVAQMFTSNWEPSHLVASGARCDVKGTFDNFDTGAGDTVAVYFLDCDGKTGFVFQEWTTRQDWGSPVDDYEFPEN